MLDSLSCSFTSISFLTTCSLHNFLVTFFFIKIVQFQMKNNCINHLTDKYLIGFIVRMFNETYLLENVEISWDWNINSRHDIASFNNCGIRYWKTIYISNAICLYRWIWLVIILYKILNLKVVTKGFSWKDLLSWKHEILHVTFTTIHKNN